MKEREHNSPEYWEERFATGDWDKYDGEGQSAFFSELALSALPEWMIRELNQNMWTVADLGCAEGSGTAVLARNFPSCRFVGVDFSPAAVEKAQKNYPFCEFRVGDVYGDMEPADVIFSSNTLEHLRDPRKVMEKMAQAARKHMILLLPLRDTTNHPEHFCIFDEGFFPLNIGTLSLSFFSEIDCSWRKSPFWPGEQLLLIYSAADEKNPHRFLSDLFSNREYLLAKGHREELEQENQKLSNELSEKQGEREILRQEATQWKAVGEDRAVALERKEQEIGQLHETQENLKRDLQDAESRVIFAGQELEGLRIQMTDIQKDLDKARQYESKTKEELAAAQKQQVETIEKLAATKEQLTETMEELAATKEQLTETTEELAEAREEAEHLRVCLTETCAAFDTRTVAIQEEEKRIRRKAIDLLSDYSNHKVFRLVHFLCRIKWQAFNHSRAERRAFWRWFFGRSKRKANNDHRYNPLFGVIDILSREPELLPAAAVAMPTKSVPVKKHIAQEDYNTYDVLIFSVIDYDFRYQRPQQIADSFARKGHRVFYINANFPDEGDIVFSQKKENLWLVTLPNKLHNAVYSTDFRDGGIDLQAALVDLTEKMGIRDAVMIADYPNWIAGISFLKRKYGFRLVTDYMDDFGGFDNAEKTFVERECIRLLKESDRVVASSLYLAELAKKYNPNVCIIRNGTEYDHFHTAFQACGHEGKKTIGYYGAISHWFDFNKIACLSQAFPEAEIVLIGAVTAGEDKLKDLPNVRLLGEKPYNELPGYLETFDVCLIPFDTSTNLIKATNPVKFYEYLSAGKKIVATEIPELEEYRDRYAYLANSDERFAEYVDLCLRGTDTLADAEECMRFARENDWMKRVDQFSDAVEELFPKISVIVLCYNQLEYTKKCVDSILRLTAYPNYELILVDNNSTDGTADWAREISKTSDRIKVVLNTENRGFAGGNNDGILASSGEYIVLLNNDTIVTRGWLTSLLKHCEESGNKSMVGPVTNSIGNEAMIRLGYEDIWDMPAAAFDYCGEHMGETYPHVKMLALFCTLFPRRMVEDIGLLDENYGVGMFEDDDYSMAAKRAGYSLILAEDAFIHHFGSATFKHLTDEKHREIFEKNKVYFEKKWNTTWEMHKYRSEYMSNN